MGKLFKNSWALFLGYGIIILAHGLQGNLLGLRAVLEDFDIIATGILMSGYFIGYFAAATFVPSLVGKVGHIRVFAAFASVASLSILIHAIFVNPYIWAVGRFLTGFSMLSIFVVVESWLNDRATNRTRGKVLSIYMVITFTCLALGVLLLNFNNPKEYEPFILVSLLLSMALIPILLTKRKPPTFKKTSSIKIKELYKISPFGSFSTFCSGFIFSAMFTMLSVYAVTMNLSVFDISILLFAVTLSGALFQWPIGSLSDKHDRRLVIIGCCILASIFAILSISASGLSFNNLIAEEMIRFNYFSTNIDKTKLFIFIILLSGMTLPLFSLNLALVNDHIPKEKFVAAGGGLNIIFGLGAMAGPIICSILMNWYGPNGFFIHLLFFLLSIILFGIFRISKRKYEDNPESTFTPLPRDITPLGIELDPTTGVDLSNSDSEKK